MFRNIVNLILITIAFATNIYSEIITNENGESFLTIGSTKDEVIEILGTPTEICSILNRWHYDSATIGFDSQNKIKEYSDSKKLKIILRPKSRTNSAKIAPEAKTATPVQNPPTNKYYSNISGYGEISKTTGRPRTKPVSGYYRKDGTYVKPYYRSI